MFPGRDRHDMHVWIVADYATIAHNPPSSFQHTTTVPRLQQHTFLKATKTAGISKKRSSAAT